MLDPSHPLAELLRRDQRFHFDSYVFVFDALRFAQKNMHLGDSTPDDDESHDDFSETENHVTGKELCEAIRTYALDQYGLLAKSVMRHWGVRSTGDFGEIVFNLIDIGQMRKTDSDRREDFDDVFDMDASLTEGFVFAPVDSPEERSA